MSYDLQFYKRTSDAISKSDIQQYLENIPLVFQEDEDSWVYQNPDTGVYCSFGFDLFDDDGDEESEHFTDFENTGLSFNINFIRPQFFGKECFPIVDQLLDELDLFVLNPQGDGEPMKYEKGELEDNWAKANLSFAKYHFKESEVGFMEQDKSDYCWNYLFKKEKLQSELGEEYFVPKIFFILNPADRTVRTCCVWPHHIPIVLPTVDFVIIQREKKKLFGKKVEDGVVKYADVIAQLGQFFENKGDYKMLHLEESEKAGPIFNQLVLGGPPTDYGEMIGGDSFVNAK